MVKAFTYAPFALTFMLAGCQPDPGSSSGKTAAIPDLSGLWARSSVEFEPPPSGPGPVTNKSRLPNGRSNLDQVVGDYDNPILKPPAAETVRRLGEISLSGNVFPDPLNQCLPQSVPYILGQLLMQIVQQPHQVTIIYEFNHQVRRVRLNSRHPDNVTPSWSGDSIGYYDGDALVIDTVGIKTGPVAMVDIFGTPYSESLHVVERYRLIEGAAASEALARNAKQNFIIPVEATGIALDPDETRSGLQIQFTVEDEGVFTTPWSAQVTFRQAANEWIEDVCSENRFEYYSNSAAPSAEAPDF